MAFKFFSKNSILFPHEKKQRNLLMISVGLFIAIFVVLYFGIFRSSPTPAPPETTSQEIYPGLSKETSGGLEEIVERINFDFNFLKEPNFQGLKLYGEWPIKVGKKGRDNPFLPY